VEKEVNQNPKGVMTTKRVEGREKKEGRRENEFHL